MHPHVLVLKSAHIHKPTHARISYSINLLLFRVTRGSGSCMTAHRPPYHCDTAPWKEPAHMHGGLAGPAGATSIFDESKSENGAPAFQNCNRRRCAYCIVNHRRPKRARGGYRIACRGWSNSAGLLCPGPHPRCGTRRFTTRVAQVRAAAAPCRRFQPPNAGDYATSPRHRAVAWLKETHEKKRPGRVHVGRKPPLCSADGAARCRDHTTREDSIPKRDSYNVHVKPCEQYAPRERHRTRKQTTESGARVASE